MKVILFVLCCLSIFSVQASEKLPLWELGVGTLPFRADHYRGSPQHNWYLFPLAAYIYRGRNIEAENGYARGHIFRGRKYVFDLSINLGLNVNSDSDRLRNGMEDLDPIFEIGPIFRYYLWKSKNNEHFVNLEFPYRAVYASNLTYVDHVGYFSVPYVNYLSKASPSTFGWTTEISIGIQYGSRGYHNWFYGVDSEYVTPDRKYYHAVSGYSGAQISVAVSRRIGNVLIIPFLRYDYLDRAVYSDSPLYKNPHYTMFGLNLLWYFMHSEKTQEAPTMVR